MQMGHTVEERGAGGLGGLGGLGSPAAAEGIGGTAFQSRIW
jgi:hypothetical protein